MIPSAPATRSALRAPATTLVTQRMRLRLPEPRDETGVERLFTDADVMRHYVDVARAGAGLRWLAAIARVRAAHGWAPWTVELLDGTFVGQCGPFPQTIDGRREIEIICFFERRFWRARYADEAVRAAIADVFARGELSRIIALIYPENRPPARLALRAGLHFERYVEQDGRTMALYALGRAAVTRNEHLEGALRSPRMAARTPSEACP